MNALLAGLRPVGVMNHFSNILKIRRPSLGEQLMVAYVRDWAIEKGFTYTIDKWNNIVVKVPATPGCERWPIVTLQAHSDMVTKRRGGGDFVWPIEIDVEGTWIHTKDFYQTLGADNGIGCSVIMDAINTPKHGPIYILITADEEKGFSGANGFDYKFHQMEKSFLINFDTPHDATVNSSSAGFDYRHARFPVARQDRARIGGYRYRLKLTKFPGGHSGEDRAGLSGGNAIKVMARLLGMLPAGSAIVSFTGGDRGNGMPEDAVAVVEVPTEVSTWRFDLDEQVKAEGKKVRCAPQLDIEEESDVVTPAFTLECTKKLLSLIRRLPDGVREFDDELEDLPTLSTTLAVLGTKDADAKPEDPEDGDLHFTQIVRGATVNQIMDLSEIVEDIFTQYDCDVREGHNGESWYQDPNHDLVQLAITAYGATGRPARLTGNHGALELGALMSRTKDSPFYAGVSIGCKIDNEHVETEATDTLSVERGYNALVYMLANANTLSA